KTISSPSLTRIALPSLASVNVIVAIPYDYPTNLCLRDFSLSSLRLSLRSLRLSGEPYLPNFNHAQPSIHTNIFSPRPFPSITSSPSARKRPHSPATVVDEGGLWPQELASFCTPLTMPPQSPHLRRRSLPTRRDIL